MISWIILMIWIFIGILNFINFYIDIKKDSRFKYYCLQYGLIWIALMTLLIRELP